jgi:hypothetical protein
MSLLMNRWVQLAAALALAGFFFWKWTGALEEIGAAEAKLDTAVQANGTNQTTITELETALKEMVASRAADALERETVLAERDKELAAAQRAAAKARRERDALFQSTPGCAELGQLRISDSCPAIADRLLKLTRRGGDEDGGDPGGGG